MSDNIQQTIVNLLNEASLHGKDQIRVQHLRHIQELILRKDPDLLDHFLEDVLTFQTDKSIEIKKTIISFIEEACQLKPQIIMKIINNLNFFLFDDNLFVQRKFILSFVSIYKSTLIWLSKSQVIDENDEHMWQNIIKIKDHIISQLSSDNDGICTGIIKFIEMYIHFLCENKQNFLEINQKIFSQTQSEQEEKRIIEKLFSFTLSPHISNTTLIAIIDALTNIVRYKSDYIIRLIQIFEILQNTLPSILTDTQVNNVHKMIKFKLFNFLKQSTSSDLQSQIQNLLTKFGVEELEILKHLPKTVPESKRKVMVNNHHKNIKKSKIINENLTENNINLPNSNRKINSIVSNQFHTVNDIIRKLSLKNVVDLVVVSMSSLPENIPPSFESVYTPIKDAGSPAHIEHLARLLSAYVTKTDYEYVTPNTNNIVGQIKPIENKINIECDDVVSCSTSYVHRKRSVESSSNVSSTTAIIPTISSMQSKKPKSSKVFDTIKPIESNEMQRISLDSFHRILQAENIDNNTNLRSIYNKIINSLVCLFKQSFSDIYKNYILDDIDQRYEFLLTWLYTEYVHANGYLNIYNENKKDFTNYNQLLCQFIEYLHNNNNNLISHLLIHVPLITDNTLLLLKQYCQDEIKNHFYMTILNDLIIRRIPIREKCLNILCSLMQNENDLIRNNARNIASNLHQKEQLKELIEKYILKDLQTLEAILDVSKQTSIEDSFSFYVGFIIPILIKLEKDEILRVLPKLIKQPTSIVKDIFNGLLKSNLSNKLSPSELLIALHQISLKECELKTIINATSLCFNERSIYTDDILTDVIEKLIEINPIPLLFMRTVLQTLHIYPKMIHFIMNILQRLINKQVWTQPRIWEGFIKCCEKTRPFSFPILLQLPSAQLKQIFQTTVELHVSLRNHLHSMSNNQRSLIPPSILTVMEDTLNHPPL